MTQAIQYAQIGGPEVLQLSTIPTPSPGPGEVLVRVEAAGVNPLDWKLRSGLRPTPPITAPRGTGNDGSGVILAVGAGVEAHRVGEPVIFTGAKSAYATEAVVPAESVVRRPANVSPELGAAIGIPAGTAYQCVQSLGVTGDDVLLVHGGSGSVGQLAIQFARLLGARVIATSSDVRADTVTALGATQVAYGPGLVDRVREVAGGEVTVALDCAGTDEAIGASLDLVADHDRIATIVRGADAPGFGIRAFSGGAAFPLTSVQQRLRQEALAVTAMLLAVGAVRIELGRSYALEDAGQAQADSQAGAAGKLTIIP